MEGLTKLSQAKLWVNLGVLVEIFNFCRILEFKGVSPLSEFRNTKIVDFILFHDIMNGRFN